VMTVTFDGFLYAPHRVAWCPPCVDMDCSCLSPDFIETSVAGFFIWLGL